MKGMHDDHLRSICEERYRHPRRLGTEGAFPDAVAIGRFWDERAKAVEIEAEVLRGRSREAIAVDEDKWAKRVLGLTV